MKKITLILGILLLSQMFANAQTKRVLIEEGTGTWCNWCPRGFVYGEQMVYDYDVIFIAIHMNDVMETAPDYVNATNINGLPAGNVDRTVMQVDPVNWETSVINQLNETPPADISVTTQFNAATRNLAMTITGDFYTALSGDYRLGAVVVEDAVTGTTTAYDQANAYAGGSIEMGGWENLPDPVPASQMVYDHVARYLASAYAGDAGSLPGTIVAGSQHSHTINWTVPADYDEEFLHVVGYLTNASTGKILNAGKSAYLLGNTNARPIFVSQPRTSGLVGVNYQYDILTHDSDNLDLAITAVDIPDWMSFSTTGPRKAVLLGTPTTEGIYSVTLNVSDGNSSSVQTFDVEIINSGGVDWHLVGNEGFTSGSASSVNLEINSSEIPYVMSVSSNNLISVHKFENEMWSLVGNTINGEESQAKMALAPDGTPYILTRSGSLKVFRYDGAAWTQVGGSLGDGFHIDITVADDGSPFVSFMDISNNSKGICKKWDGSSWITVGGAHFSGNQVAVWTKVKTNSSNQPVVLYGTGPSGNGPFYSNVSQFNGTNWEVVGGGDIDGGISTYFTHSLAVDSGNQFYVGLTANTASKKLNVYEWNGTSWANIGDDISGGDTYNISVALDLQEKPVVGFRDESEGGKTTVMRFDENSWSTLGLAGFTNIASYQSLVYSPNGSPYIAYQDEENNYKATVKRYGPEVLNIVDYSADNVDIRVFPNPNSGDFTLMSNRGGRYQLIDLQGRIIAEGLLEAINYENDMSTYSLKYPNLSKGIYLLNVINADKRDVVKIIVQ